MQYAFVESFGLIGASGYVILLAIVGVLVAGVVANFVVGGRYARLERELLTNPTGTGPFTQPVLGRIVSDARLAFEQGQSSDGHQALIENAFVSELRGPLLAERFVRAATGLLIVLGLVGTFYGLTSSIGRLVSLVTAETPEATEIGQMLTQGLSQALSGMAVAFTTSLFGIVAAIIMILLNVVSNVGDRRTAVMVRIEHYLDGLAARWQATDGPRHGAEPPLAGTVARFGDSVAHLEDAVARFDAALQSFAGSTREFGEFNRHLKDNIQRMSLSFADLSNALQDNLRGAGPRPRA
jgi:hypothetical protein